MNLLLADFHHLGDVVLSWPFQRSALAAGYRLHVVCRPSAEPLQKLAFPEIPVTSWDPPWHEESPTKHGWQPWRQVAAVHSLARFLRPSAFDAAVSVWPDPRVACLFAWAGIPRRIGYASTEQNWYAAHRPWRRRALFTAATLQRGLGLCGCTWTQALSKAAATPHQLESWRQLGAALGITVDETPPWFTPPLPSSNLPYLAKNTDGRRRIALHAGARLPSKQWPLDRWRELARRCLSDPSWEVIEIAAPELSTLEIPNLPVVRPQSMADLVQVLAASDLLVAHDSLPAHLMAALGRPVRAIFGSGSPQWFAPGRDPASAISDSTCPDKPCLDRCTQPSFVCLERITVDQVWQSVLSAATESKASSEP
jgi:ADP-heptose:LPS heptosyltransferase